MGGREQRLQRATRGIPVVAGLAPASVSQAPHQGPHQDGHWTSPLLRWGIRGTGGQVTYLSEQEPSPVGLWVTVDICGVSWEWATRALMGQRPSWRLVSLYGCSTRT